MNEKYTFSINKTYIVFIVNIFYLSLIGYIVLYITDLDKKYSTIIASNKKLEVNNEILLNTIRSLEEKLENTRIIQEVYAAPEPLPMSDEYKIFLIKVIIFLIISVLGFFSLWYIYSYIKVYLLSLFVKGASSVGTVNSYFSYFLSKKNIKSFKCRDSYDNVLSIKLNEADQTFEIFIKPFNLNETYLLEDFFRLNLERFSLVNTESAIVEEVIHSLQDVIGQGAVNTESAIVEEVIFRTQDIITQAAANTESAFVEEVVRSLQDVISQVAVSTESANAEEVICSLQDVIGQAAINSEAAFVEEVIRSTQDVISQVAVNTESAFVEEVIRSTQDVTSQIAANIECAIVEEVIHSSQEAISQAAASTPEFVSEIIANISSIF